GAVDLGLANYLQQRGASAIEIDEAIASAALLVVQHLAGVLFEVSADDADALGPSGGVDLEPAILAEGEVVLADLIVLGQVGVVVVLAVPLGEAGNRAVEGQGGAQGQLESAAVHDRERPRQAHADGADRRVGRQAELRTATTKELRARQQLDVYLQPDDDAVRKVRHELPTPDVAGREVSPKSPTAGRAVNKSSASS